MTLSLARPLPLPEPEASDTDRSDGEILAAIIEQGDSGREARQRARDLLDVAGGTWGLPRLSRSQLSRAGLSDDSIARVKAAIALGARVAAAAPPARAMDVASVVSIFRPLLRHLTHEELHVVLIDARGRYLSRRRVSSGGTAACSVFIKDVLAPVVEARASAIYMVHNHPSGVSGASHEDVNLTIRVHAASETLGVTLLDHIIVADDGFSSAMPVQLREQRRSA